MADFPDFFRLPDDTPKLPRFGVPLVRASTLLNLDQVDDDDLDDDDLDDDDFDDDDFDLDLDDDEADDDCLSRHLKSLSEHYPLWLDDDYRFVIVQDVRLPPGYNYQDIDFLVQLPPDYPLSPPGIGDNRIYTYRDLRYRGRPLEDLHVGTFPKFSVPDKEQWAWFCYRQIKWFSLTDDLVMFMEMVRTDLTDPRVK